MKVIFLLDTSEYLELAPEKLQLRQVEPAISALGCEVKVPVRNADGEVEKNEDGSVKTQMGFMPLITYPVVLTPAPQPTPADPETVVIHKDGVTRVTDSNDPEAKLLAAGGAPTGRKVRKSKMVAK